MTTTSSISGAASLLSWILQLLAAAILLQMCYYKLSGTQESIYIFATVGMEPWGRYVSAIAELIAGLLLLFPRTSWMGALLGSIVVSVAIYFHLGSLGIEITGDGGALFYLASTVFISGIIIIYLRRNRMSQDCKKWMKKGTQQGEKETTDRTS